MDDPIDFSAFGRGFLETLLTPTLLRAQIIAAIPPVTYIEAPLQGQATFHPDDPDVLMIGQGAFGSDEVAFSIQVRLGLSLSLNGKSLPAFSIAFAMQIAFRTYGSLVLLADIAPLTETDVTVQWKVSELERIEGMLIAAGALALLQPAVVAMLGADKLVSGVIGCVELLVAGKVREAVNEEIEASLPSRIIDLEAMLLEKASADRKPAGGGPLLVDPGGMLVPRETTATVTIAPGGRSDVGLLLRRGEGIKLLLYAQIGFAPPLIFPGAVLEWRFGLVGTDLDDDTDSEQVTGGWSGIYTRFAVPQASSLRQETFYKAAVGGCHVLRLSNPAASGAPIEIIVRQERRLEPEILAAGRRIDFATFGQNFIKIGLSPSFFREQFAPKLAAPIRQKWSNDAVGEVEVLATIKLGNVDEIPSDSPAYRALRRVALTMTVDLLRTRGKTVDRLVRRLSRQH